MKSQLMYVVVVFCCVSAIHASEQVGLPALSTERGVNVRDVFECVTEMLLPSNDDQQMQNACEPVGLVGPVVCGVMCCRASKQCIGHQLENIQKAFQTKAVVRPLEDKMK